MPGAGPRGSVLLPASVRGADQHPPTYKWRGERDHPLSAGGSGSKRIEFGMMPRSGAPPVAAIPTHPTIPAGILPDALPGGFIGREEATSPHPLVNIGGVKDGGLHGSEGPCLPDEGLGQSRQP